MVLVRKKNLVIVNALPRLARSLPIAFSHEFEQVLGASLLDVFPEAGSFPPSSWLCAPVLSGGNYPTASTAGSATGVHTLRLGDSRSDKARGGCGSPADHVCLTKHQTRRFGYGREPLPSNGQSLGFEARTNGENRKRLK